MAEIKKRTKKNGKISYTASIRIKGYPSLNATFDKLTDARIWANNYESAMKLGRHIKDAEAKKHTLAELIDRYIHNELPRRKSDQEKFEMQLLWWKNKVGAYLLSDITPALLSNYKEVLGTEESPKPKNGNTTRSNATVNRYMACLSVVLTKAVKEWQWMEENPMLKVAKLQEPRGRVRFLSDKERVNLLEACKQISYELYLVVLIAITTGARYSEIVNLKRQEIDFDNGLFHFMDTKNGEDRGVPIPAILHEELKEFTKVIHIKSDYIFIRPDGKKLIYFRNKFDDAVEKADITDFHFHDLRHTAASYLAMNGAGVRELAEILGHKTMAMVQRYSHLTKKHTALLINNMAEKMINGSV